jgi:multiple sugar transport system permease protein
MGLFKNRLRNYITGFIIIAVLVVNILPWLWMFLAAFKTRVDLLSTNPIWVFKPTLENFPAAFIDHEFLKYLTNSVIISAGAVILGLAIGIPAAYGFSRYRVMGQKHIFFGILTTRMAPPIVLALPLYILFAKLAILGTHIAVILAHSTFTLSFVIWMMKGFFDDLPLGVEAAALTDGYSQFQVFRKISLPLVKPGIVATALFSFIFSWNEFLFALVLAGENARTLPAGFPGLVTPHGTYWGQVSAAGAVVSIPVLILVFILQKHLVRGLTLGAVTG